VIEMKGKDLVELTNRVDEMEYISATFQRINGEWVAMVELVK